MKILKKARLNKLYEKSNKKSIPFENYQIDISDLPDLELFLMGREVQLNISKIIDQLKLLI